MWFPIELEELEKPLQLIHWATVEKVETEGKSAMKDK